MPISVIFGGQYGSEGKGKTAAYFAKKQNAKAVIRVGGPNSGHTVIDKNEKPIIFKHLPTSALQEGVKSILPSGHYINIEILKKELEIVNIKKPDLLIDPYAVIIDESDIKAEQSGNLKENIGSTGSGIGSAIVKRINRQSNNFFAKDCYMLKPFIQETTPFLQQLLDTGERVIIEGTQGFGLSLLHSNHYPFCTSRDTSAAAFVSEAGLSPLDVDDIIMVLRSYPIRVGGNSGELKNETTWAEISKKAKQDVIEFTSVTGKVRRIGEFDNEIVKKSILYNKPTTIVLNHVDYLDLLSYNEIKKYLIGIANQIGKDINYYGIDRKELFHI